MCRGQRRDSPVAKAGIRDSPVAKVGICGASRRRPSLPKALDETFALDHGSPSPSQVSSARSSPRPSSGSRSRPSSRAGSRAPSSAQRRLASPATLLLKSPPPQLPGWGCEVHTGDRNATVSQRPPLPNLLTRGPVRAKWPLTPKKESGIVADKELPQTDQQPRRSSSVDRLRGTSLVGRMQSPASMRAAGVPSRRSPTFKPRCWDEPCWAWSHPETCAAAVSVAEEANWTFRNHMEDRHKILDPLPVHVRASLGRKSGEECWGFYAVYDGHGGHEAADFCQAHLHEYVALELQHLPRSYDKSPDRNAVFTALAVAFKRVDAKLAQAGCYKNGCTATVALTHVSAAGTMLYVANVGDSRGMFFGGQSMRQVTSDHLASEPTEHRRIQQDGGFVLHGRVCGCLMVSRSLGDHELKEGGVSCLPDVFACKVSTGRALVLASDGLWDVMDGMGALTVLEDSINRASAQAPDAEAAVKLLHETAASSLVQTAKQRGSHDNILALVVFF